MARTIQPRKWRKGIILSEKNKELAWDIAVKRQEWNRANGKKDMQKRPGNGLELSARGMAAEIAFALMYGQEPNLVTDDTNTPDFVTVHGETIDVKSTVVPNAPLSVPEHKITWGKESVYYVQVVNDRGNAYYVTGYADYRKVRNAPVVDGMRVVPQSELEDIPVDEWFTEPKE
jgi:hypothetical protein